MPFSTWHFSLENSLQVEKTFELYRRETVSFKMVKTSFLLNIIANRHYVTHCSLDFALLITKLSNAYLRIHLVLASGKELAGQGSHSQFSE